MQNVRDECRSDENFTTWDLNKGTSLCKLNSTIISMDFCEIKEKKSSNHLKENNFLRTREKKISLYFMPDSALDE